MRWIGRTWRGLLLAALGVAGALGLLHAQAPAARASCDGGIEYSYAVAKARAAVVGRVIETRESGGFLYVSAVRVERAVGIGTGPVFRHRVQPGLCGSDWPTVGTRVVVLLGVPNPVPGGPSSDLFFTVGRTVTAAQAAHVALDLPDTAIAPSTTPGPAGARWVAPAMAAIAGLLILLSAPSRRRRSARA